jgi:hypothetical protein
MSSILTKVHSGESCTDHILSFSKLVRDAEKELSLLQIELGKAKGSVDMRQLCTLLVNIQDGGSARDLIVRFLRGLAVVRARLSGTSFSINCSEDLEN